MEGVGSNPRQAKKFSINLNEELNNNNKNSSGLLPVDRRQQLTTLFSDERY